MQRRKPGSLIISHKTLYKPELLLELLRKIWVCLDMPQSFCCYRGTQFWLMHNYTNFSCKTQSEPIAMTPLSIPMPANLITPTSCHLLITTCSQSPSHASRSPNQSPGNPIFRHSSSASECLSPPGPACRCTTGHITHSTAPFLIL